MILLTFFFLLITLDMAHESWRAGMRQIGSVIAVCGILGFGGALFSTTPLLFIPLAGVLVFCLLASVQMRKYRVGPHRHRDENRTEH